MVMNYGQNEKGEMLSAKWSLPKNCQAKCFLEMLYGERYTDQIYFLTDQPTASH